MKHRRLLCRFMLIPCMLAQPGYLAAAQTAQEPLTAPIQGIQSEDAPFSIEPLPLAPELPSLPPVPAAPAVVSAQPPVQAPPAKPKGPKAKKEKKGVPQKPMQKQMAVQAQPTTAPKISLPPVSAQIPAPKVPVGRTPLAPSAQASIGQRLPVVPTQPKASLPQTPAPMSLPKVPAAPIPAPSVPALPSLSKQVREKRVRRPGAMKKELSSKAALQESLFEPEEIVLPTFPLNNIFPEKGPFIVVTKNQKLSDFIDMIAEKKKINVVFADAIANTINFPEKRKLPLNVAEDYLYTFLSMAGFAMYERDGFFVVAKQTEANVARKPLPVYVNVKPEDLPKTDEQIWTINYFANLRVPEAVEGGDNPLVQVLKDMIPVSCGTFFFDPKSNASLICAPSRRVAAALDLLERLDNAGTKEKLEWIRLFNTSARDVAKLFNEQQLIARTRDIGRFRASIKSYEDLYFAPNTRVIAYQDDLLLVIGQEATIERIKDLIRENIDVPPESGRSVLHVYNLQYLKAADFESVLQKIVQTSDSDQSRREAESGGQRWFDNPVIIAEREETSQQAKVAGAAESGLLGGVTLGGNRLIIACTTSDWKRIKSLIDELDKPQPQVILEVLVVDLDFIGSKGISTQLRNPTSLGLPNGVSFQSAQFAPQIVDRPSGTVDTTLATDLLRLVSPDTAPTVSIAAQSTATSSGQGAMIISLNDPQSNSIWSVLKILEQWTERKVLAHPIIVAKHNMQARVYSKELLYDTGGITSAQTVNTSIKYEPYTATFEVKILPRISSLDRVNLSIYVETDDFIDRVAKETSNRSVTTNATLSSGQILVMGGLTRWSDAETEYAVPFLSRIPLIGWFFKGKTRTKTRSNLAVFIQPTIVDPKLRSGINRFTNDRINEIKARSTQLFSNLMDPVSNFFFGTDTPGMEMMKDYVERSRHKGGPDTEATAATTIGVAPEQSSRKLQEMLQNEKNPLSGSAD